MFASPTRLSQTDESRLENIKYVLREQAETLSDKSVALSITANEPLTLAETVSRLYAYQGIEGEVAQDISRFLSSILKMDPKKRLSLEEIGTHLWIKD